jgi:hypothetical protein
VVSLYGNAGRNPITVNGEWICAASRKRFSAIEAASVHLVENKMRTIFI